MSFTETGHTSPFVHDKKFRLCFRGSGGAVNRFSTRKWHDLNYAFESSHDYENGLWEGRAEGCPGGDDSSLEEDSGERE